MSDCKTYWLHALTPVHVGVGFGSGFIDLPIMREKITDWPLIPGSSVKGVQRELFDTRIEKASEPDKTRLKALTKPAFGDGGDDSANAGAIVFTDARIVCLAARSYYGTFAYVTCPLVLSRLARDAEAAGSALANMPAIFLEPEKAVVPADDSGVWHPTDHQICLGELNLPCTVSAGAEEWAAAIGAILFPEEPWKSIFRKRFVVAPDDTFDFLSETGCEVNARIKMEQARKIVERGHFWYEESLPTESILSGLVWCDKIYAKNSELSSAEVLAEICGENTILQVGGKATVGKGRMRCCYENAHV